MSAPATLPGSFTGEKNIPGTSNVSGGEVPFQRWYNFKEAFAPSFVEEVIASMPHSVRTCTDPFGGCGTTALTSQFLGIRPTTIEVNPFLADLIESKLTTYSVSALIKDRCALATICADTSFLSEAQVAMAFGEAPATLLEPGVAGRWIFDADVAERIVRYRWAIDRIENEAHRRLFRVLLGSVLVPVSNVVISGKGRRYRSNWRERRRIALDVDRLFDSAFQAAVFDITRYPTCPCRDYTLLRGDSRRRLAEAEPADLVLFSPPYPNSFDYTDIYNVELWALGYLSSRDSNRELREATLRSHVQIKREFAVDALGSETLATTLTALRTVQADLWNMHIPDMVAAYFEDLLGIICTARDRLTPGGCLAMVVGDSRYAGILVNVPRIIAEMVSPTGLRCEEIRPVRSMRTSAQQGGELTLGESLVRLALA